MEKDLKSNLLEIGNKLRKAREENKLTRPEACKLLDISKSTLQAWENGEREPSISQLLNATAVYNVTFAYFVDSHDNQDAKKITPLQQNKLVHIPLYNEMLLNQSHAVEQPFSMVFSQYWIDHYVKANINDLSIIIIKGDSMQGVLNEGDAVLVNHSDKDVQEGIYVLQMDGHILVKQLQCLPNLMIKVTSTNSSYDSFLIDLKNPPLGFEVIGRVVWFSRVI